MTLCSTLWNISLFFFLLSLPFSPQICFFFVFFFNYSFTSYPAALFLEINFIPEKIQFFVSLVEKKMKIALENSGGGGGETKKFIKNEILN